MIDEFKKKVNEDPHKNIIIPDNADPDDIVEKDGLPSTPQIKGFQAMREQLADEKPKADQIVVRQRAEVAIPEGRTLATDLLDVPKLCDQCYLIDKCPHFEPNTTCYFRTAIQINDQSSLVELMQMMITMQGQRVLFGRLIEQSEGGYIDQNLSKEMKLLMDLMKDMKEILAPPQETVTIKASGPAKPGGGGIISQLFGGGGAKSE
jgi:hypothetical protein